MSTEDRIICTDGGCNNAWTAAMMNNSNWNNSPWMYLIFLALFGGNGFGWNRNGMGLETGENYNSRQIAALQGTVNDNHNNDLAMQALNGNRDAMGQLAQTFNCDMRTIQQGICGVKSAIEQVGGAVGYTSESVKNAIALGDRDIIQQMCNCCCQQKELVQRMGYENQLASERQTGIITSQMAANHSADQLQNCQNHGATIARIDQLANGVQTLGAELGYQAEKNTNSILQGQNAQTQAILGALNNHWTQDLRDKLFEQSQAAQTASIVAQLKTTT